MKCPFCSHADTQVVETRISEDGGFIRRRRQCASCQKRFTTYERPDVTFPSIVKKDGRRIEYERAKLLASMKLALRKRPVSTEQVDGAVERIEEKLLMQGGARAALSPPGRTRDARAQKTRQSGLCALCQRVPQL